MKIALKSLLLIITLPFWIICGILIGIIKGIELGEEIIYGKSN